MGEIMKHLGTKCIETPRLILRRFEVEDAPAAYKNWVTDPEVTKYLTWPPHSSVEVTRGVIADWSSYYGNDNYYQWAITLKANGSEPIGSMSVVKQNDDIGMVHIGYCIGKQWWNQGITSEALTALISFFFEDVGINRIEIRHDPNNPNSGKVMKKCGLLFEGTMRQADKNNQGVCDMVYYGLLAEDYWKLNRTNM